MKDENVEKPVPTTATADTDQFRRSILKATAFGAAAAAVGPFFIKSVSAQSRPIRIGFPVPLTGPYASGARDQANCAQIAVDEFNAAGGLNGRMAELLIRDGKLNPGAAATRTLELIENDKADFICGALSASVQLSVNEVAKSRKIIYNSISQSDAINEVGDFSPYTFHEALNPHLTGAAVGRYVFPKYGKRVAFLVSDYAYGHEMARAFKQAGEEFGIEVVAEVLHPLGTQDYSTFLPRIQAARPDVLIICNFGRDQLNSIKQATAFGMKQRMQIAVPVLLFNQRLSGGAGIFEGVVGGANFYWSLEERFDSAKSLNAEYRKRHDGAPPSDYGAYGYAGVRSLLLGAKAAGSTETDAVIAALEELKYDSYKGNQYFRGCDHQSVQSVLILGSTPEQEMRDKYDLFRILHVAEADESLLRSCEALGHKA